jgi:FkbM family methyltransferase
LTPEIAYWTKVKDFARHLEKAARPILEPIKPYYMRNFGLLPRGEKGAVAFFSKYIKRDDVVIEVGANRGGSTLNLSKLASHVYALEPVHSTFRYLRVFTAQKENVSVYNVGAGNVEGKIEYFMGGSSYVNSRFLIEDQQYIGRAWMRIVRLDSVDFLPQPTCLVMDCEGSEVDALTGAAGLFDSKSIRCVLIETHRLSDGTETLEAVLAIIKRYNFEFEVAKDADGLPWVLARR